MRILGIDPGLAIVGFGLIEAETGKTQMLQYGAVTTPAGLPLAARLVQLERDMEELIAQLRPEAIAVEELFFSNNITTGIAVAHARGKRLRAHEKKLRRGDARLLRCLKHAPGKLLKIQFHAAPLTFRRRSDGSRGWSAGPRWWARCR